MIVELFCLAFSITATVFNLLNNDLSKWYTYLFAILSFAGAYFIAVALAFIIYYIICLPIKAGSEYKKPSKFYRFLYKEGLDYICFHARVSCRFKGKDLLPRGKRFLLVCNHRSNFDPMLIAKKTVAYDIAFISKNQNFKVPLANRIITAVCYMSVDRNDPLQSLTIFKRASNYVNNNICSIGVFPEGKRYVGDGVEEFHEGFFNVAIKNNIPLVVCTVKGTENIAKNFPFRKTKVKIEVLRVFEPEEINQLPAKTLSDTARELMIENLKEDQVNAKQ